MLRPPYLTRQLHQCPSLFLHTHSSPLRPLSLLRPFLIVSPPQTCSFQFPREFAPPYSIRHYATPPRPSPSSPSHSRPPPPPGSNPDKPKYDWSTFVVGRTLDNHEKKRFWIHMRKYVSNWEFVMRVIYRMLLVTVIIYPLWVFSHGPIKINHRDGEYEAFQLVSRKEVAKDHYELVLKRKLPTYYSWGVYEKEIPESTTLARRTPILSLRIENPSLQIERSYTPLTMSPNDIRLIIKLYPNGELSRFLHILTPGMATVWVNQGRQEWIYQEGEWDHVIFVCGGTGITPAYQLCSTALERQKILEDAMREKDQELKKTRFSVVCAVRDVPSILLRDEFQDVKRQFGQDGLLDVKYFVDSWAAGIPKGIERPGDMFPGPITEKVIRETIKRTKKEPEAPRGWFQRGEKKKEEDPMLVVRHEKVMVLVCGPNGFTSYIAGPHGGVAHIQGPKGGLLTNVEGIELFKLLESRGLSDVELDRLTSRKAIRSQ